MQADMNMLSSVVGIICGCAIIAIFTYFMFFEKVGQATAARDNDCAIAVQRITNSALTDWYLDKLHKTDNPAERADILQALADLNEGE